ncbi:hypothetical protein [Pendulispora albinea]|uniref:COMM domain-containing protein n=1 Tax=Pendulispora albinea TaxID=2741071 RepID=A0ABZ2M0C5_9BACT
MPKPFTVPRHLLPSLAQLRDMPEGHLDELVDHVRDAGTLLSEADLQKSLDQFLPKEAVKPLIELLLSLYSLQKQNSISTEEVIHGISAALTHLPQPHRWDDAQIRKWNQRTSQLIALLSLDNLYLLDKAVDLRFEQTNVLLRMRLLADVRPVFARDVPEPRGAIVTQTLRLEYLGDGDGLRKSISFAMDAKDIKELHRQCERALAKAKAIATLLNDKAQLRTSVSGESDDD